MPSTPSQSNSNNSNSNSDVQLIFQKEKKKTSADIKKELFKNILKEVDKRKRKRIERDILSKEQKNTEERKRKSIEGHLRREAQQLNAKVGRKTFAPKKGVVRKKKNNLNDKPETEDNLVRRLFEKKVYQRNEWKNRVNYYLRKLICPYCETKLTPIADGHANKITTINYVCTRKRCEGRGIFVQGDAIYDGGQDKKGRDSK